MSCPGRRKLCSALYGTAACVIAVTWLVASGRGLMHWALWSKESIGDSPVLSTCFDILASALLLAPLSLWCSRKSWRCATESGAPQALAQVVALGGIAAFPSAAALLMAYWWLLSR